MGTGGEIHLLHRMFEVAVTLSVQLAVLPDLAGAHRRVGGIRKFPETLSLDLSRRTDPRTDGFGFLTDMGVRRKFTEIHQRNLDVEVDPVQ